MALGVFPICLVTSSRTARHGVVDCVVTASAECGRQFTDGKHCCLPPEKD